MNEEFLPNIPRLFTAIAEWAACMIYIYYLPKRIKGWLLYLFFIAGLGAIIGLQLVAGSAPIAFWVPGMIAAAVIMFLFIYVCCDISILSAAIWTIQAFIVAEFAASLEWQLYYYYFINFNFGKTATAKILFLIVTYAIVFFSIYLLESRYMKNKTVLDIRKRDLYTVFTLVLTVFIISNISFISINTPFSGRFGHEIFYIRTLVDLCGIILLISQREQKLWLHAKAELSAMQNVLTKQYANYCQSKESIEYINRKYHDLKHQIQIIRAEKNPNKKTEYLNEMERGMRLYETQYNTGNSVLDTVLTTKSSYFLDNNINFTCVADGKLLNFMDVMDICSIFGNAFDNAVESISNLKDSEKKLIKLTVYSRKDLLIIRFDNYFENTLNYENGNLTTTKSDKINHGYGIKSIKLAAAKYGGHVKINTVNNWFSLCLLIPLEENIKTNNE